jgi:predicted nucleotidyltransferase
MNVSKIKKLLYNQAPLRILSFLSLRSRKVFSAREISQATCLSKGTTHKVLRLFIDLNILSKEHKGNAFLYTLQSDNVLLKQFKIFENIFALKPVIEKIKSYCYQIILFGSCANGDNINESDMDLFIKSECDKKTILKLIDKYSSKDMQINSAIFDSLEIAKLQKEDKVFLEQIKKGITLWEGKPEYENL